MYGTYETIDGKPAVRFEREYPQAVDRVWRMITVPEELAQWFPTTVEVDLREGGEMRFTFLGGEMEPMDGRVVELDAPEPDGTRLTLTHLISNADEAARNAAGWHVCLDKLGGEESDWEPLYEEYRRRGLPSGAEIPAER